MFEFSRAAWPCTWLDCVFMCASVCVGGDAGVSMPASLLPLPPPPTDPHKSPFKRAATVIANLFPPLERGTETRDSRHCSTECRGGGKCGLFTAKGWMGRGLQSGVKRGAANTTRLVRGRGWQGCTGRKVQPSPPPSQLTLKAGDSMTVPFPPMLPSLRNRGFRRKKGGVVVLGPGLMARVTLVTFET